MSGLQFSIKQSAPEKVRAACVAVGITEPRKLSHAAELLDRASDGAIRAVVAAGDMEGKAGTTRLLYRIPGVEAERVLLVGLGKDTGAKQFRDAVRAAASALADTGAADACFYLGETAVRGVDTAWKARHLVMAASEALYRFDELKSKKREEKPLAKLVLGVTGRGSTT